MRNLVGLEMLCFAASRHFRMEYEAGCYIDEQGNRVDNVLDMGCFSCSAAYFTLQGDFCPYCPNCGFIDRKRFEDKEALVGFLRGLDFSWLKLNGMRVVYVHTFEGDWQLRFSKDPDAMERSGQFRAVSIP